MKTLKLIAPMLFMLTLLYSCTTEEYYEDNSYHTKNFSDEVIVNSNQWTLQGDPNQIGSYYESILYFEELDDSKYPNNVRTPYFNGIITVSLYYKYDTKEEIQIPLPYTEYYVETVNGEEVNYSIQYSYDLQSNGTIAFKVHASDYYTGTFRPGTIYFKVAAVW